MGPPGQRNCAHHLLKRQTPNILRNRYVYHALFQAQILRGSGRSGDADLSMRALSICFGLSMKTSMPYSAEGLNPASWSSRHASQSIRFKAS
ncbi:hypothetical protein VTN02DRAFT_6592 [Thermoascus thermophilus]